MEFVELSRFAVSFLFVIGLILAIGWLVKKFAVQRSWANKLTGKNNRLHIEESLMIDPRRRLVLIRCDDKEHLILMGATGEQVVDVMPVGKEDAKKK